jgi:mannose-1-phosphate guanylyltransferase/mannose-6-phosphate isomerase
MPTVENVLVIVIDALRRDRVGAYGDSALTPNLDRVADDGATFQRCYAPINATDAAMTSLLSGCYPTRHGVLNHGRNVTSEERAAVGDDLLLLVLPADHVIAATCAFVEAVWRAAAAAEEGRLVTFGIVPDRPETGYGYLLKGKSLGGHLELERFVEKPDRETAEVFVESGRYLWNSGMFVFRAGDYLDELRRLAPEMAAACAAAVESAETDADFTRLGEAFTRCPADSIDYAVMEKTDRAAVVELEAGWSDVGSWDALHDVLEKDGDGNALVGDVLAEDCRGSYIAARSRLVAAVGLEDIVVVETGDAVLVTPRARSQDVKRIVDAPKSAGRREVREHGAEAREDEE